jgi:chromosome segregation ATPase
MPRYGFTEFFTMWELWIPFVGSVAVTIMLRRLDRSNLKLSKLKKYVSRVLEEFDRNARMREKEFKDASIDFEIQIRQGRALLEDMQAETSAIAERLEALKGDRNILGEVQEELSSVIQSTDNVREQVNNIDEALDRLSRQKKDLSKVEHQLARVRREAGEMVQAFSTKVKTISDDLFHSLDEKVQSIEEHYIQKENQLFEDNQEHLHNYVGKLQNEFEEIKTDLSRSVDVILEETHNRVDSYGNKLEQMDRSISTARESADQQLHHIREESLRFTAEAESQFSKIQTQIATTEDDINQVRENLYKELYNESKRIRGELQDFNLEAIAKKDEIVNAARREAEGIHKQLEEFQVRYLESENKLFREADARNAELVGKLDTFEEDFNRIQKQHLSELEQRLEKLASEYQEQSHSQLARTADDIDKLQSRLSAQLEESMQAQTQAVKGLKATIQGEWKGDLTEKRELMKELSGQIQILEKKVSDETSKWQQQLEETSISLQSQAKEMLTGSKEELVTMTESIREQMEKDFELLQKENKDYRESVFSDTRETIGRLEETADLLRKDNEELCLQWEEKIKQFSEDLVRRYTTENESLVQSSEKNIQVKLEGLSARLDADLENMEHKGRVTREGIVAELETVAARSRTEMEGLADMKTALMKEIHNDTTSIRGELQLLKDEVTEYQTVARVFTDADRMARELDSKIGELKNNLQLVNSENDKVDEFMERLSGLKDMRKDLEAEISKVEKRQKVIDEFEGSLSTVLNLSDSVTAKIKGLENNREKIDEIDRGMKRFSEIFRTIDTRFEEVLEHRAELDETNRKLQESSVRAEQFSQRAEEIEGGLEKVRKKAGTVFSFLKEIETKSLLLTSREEDIRAVEARFEEIEDLGIDLDERVKQIQSMAQKVEKMRSWMEKQQDELKELGYEAENKIQKLTDFMDGMETPGLLTKSMRSAPAVDSQQSKRDFILELAKNRKWTVDEISQHLNLDKGYVNTVLSTSAP